MSLLHALPSVLVLALASMATGFTPLPATLHARHHGQRATLTIGMAVKGREIEQIAALIPDAAAVKALISAADDGIMNREAFGSALACEPPLSQEAVDQIWKLAGATRTSRSSPLAPTLTLTIPRPWHRGRTDHSRA